MTTATTPFTSIGGEFATITTLSANPPATGQIASLFFDRNEECRLRIAPGGILIRCRRRFDA